MVQKPERGRYLVLEDVRFSYNHRKDAISITSSDPDLNSGSFHMVLNNGTETEEALREILIEHGLIKTNEISENPILDTLRIPEVSSHHFSLELSTKNKLGTPSKTLFVGMPGTGKSYLLSQLAYLSGKMSDTVIFIHKDRENYISQFAKENNTLNDNVITPSVTEFSLTEQNNSLTGLLNPFDLYTVDNEIGTKTILEIIFLLSNHQKAIINNIDYIKEAINIIGSQTQASLTMLAQHFIDSSIPEIRKLGEELKTIRHHNGIVNIFYKTSENKFNSFITPNNINIINLELKNYHHEYNMRTLIENIDDIITLLTLKFVTLYNNSHKTATVFIDGLNNSNHLQRFVLQNSFVHVASNNTHKITENIYDKIAIFKSQREYLEDISGLTSQHYHLISNLTVGQALLKQNDNCQLMKP
jgi:hypothetical protein